MALPARFWAKVNKTDGCWIWTAANVRGYGHFSYGGRRRLTHRLVYEEMRGAIPSGLQIDHLCRNPSCVNPDHLEPVTGRVNTLRSPTNMATINAAKTHCPRGHEYTSDNTYLAPNHGGRHCRTCARAWMAADRARRRAEAFGARVGATP